MSGEGAAQLTLAIGHRTSFAGEDFLVAPSNRDAVAWLDRWPEWPGTALVLHGPSGCGKTHLVHMFLARTAGVAVSLAMLASRLPEDTLGDYPAAAIDDADQIASAGLEEALLHLFNTARDAGRGLLLTAAEPPARWPLGLPDLRSRLTGSPLVGISPPDDHLLAAVMVKQFADRQIFVDDGLVAYLLPRIERSFAAVRRVVDRLDAAALAEQRPVTLPLARAVLRADSGACDAPDR